MTMSQTMLRLRARSFGRLRLPLVKKGVGGSLSGLRSGSWGSSARGDSDVVAEGAKGLESALLAAVAVALVEEVAAEVGERDVVQEHEVDRGDEGVGDGDDGALAAAAGG